MCNRRRREAFHNLMGAACSWSIKEDVSDPCGCSTSKEVEALLSRFRRP